MGISELFQLGGLAVALIIVLWGFMRYGLPSMIDLHTKTVQAAQESITALVDDIKLSRKEAREERQADRQAFLDELRMDRRRHAEAMEGLQDSIMKLRDEIEENTNTIKSCVVRPTLKTDDNPEERKQ
jgi:hypothetical protein